ncbi:hypothetical protein X975_21289, partial [Stegodyphus mimosarum]
MDCKDTIATIRICIKCCMRYFMPLLSFIKKLKNFFNSFYFTFNHTKNIHVFRSIFLYF